MQTIAARDERFHADHPKGRSGDEQRCEAAGNPDFGESQAAVSDADDDDAVEGGEEKFLARRQVRFGEEGDQQENRS